MRPAIIVETISILFVMLFLYTGVSKILEYEVFKEQIRQVAILSPFSSIIAGALPVAEFIIAGLLLFSKTRLAGLYLSAIFMLLFTIYVLLILLFSKDLPCSCGGIIAELSWQQHLTLNIILTALGVLGILLKKDIRARPSKEKLPAMLN